MTVSQRSITLVASLAIGAAAFLAMGASRGENDVAIAIKRARTCRFEMRTVFSRPDRIVEGVVSWRANPRAYRFDRRESNQATTVDILRAEKAGIAIDLERKTYRDLPARRNGDLPPALMLNVARFFGQPKYELARQRIDHAAADGVEVPFQLVDPAMGEGKVRMWVDAESRLPLLIEYASDDPRMGVKTLRSFRWDGELADSLFDARPPNGFADVTPKSVELEGQIKAIVQALRIYAKAFDGAYPPYPKIYGDVVINKLKSKLGVTRNTPVTEQSYAEYVESTLGFAHMSAICRDNSDAKYGGQTVTAADKDKVLFRWKTVDGDFQVIYGDLHNETVSKDELRELEKR